MVNGQNVPFSYGDEGFTTQGLPLPAHTACYDCRWTEMNTTASFVTADYAPGSDSLSLGHPDLSTANSGYHFAVNPMDTGTDINGDQIVTRLSVYMRVEANRTASSYVDRPEHFGRYLVTGTVEFTSTDGINYVIDAAATAGDESQLEFPKKEN